ncbi:hypothetical protein L210DRAFT_1059836 [Boletus edulis BED1]|uniref:BSD domain-containing protein n=1 Tax=Boletus edulis BED1 TaxID=1328754 RepID=A0AAD4BZB0_BOLED|nr:hypothetical protein L210DRAFT_1059836 [Boletus edulis BED1]
MQGVTRAQAEEYVHKSETLLREVMKEAGDVLREAVKVIPPEASATDGLVVWDGADIWMLPGLAASADGSTTGGVASKGVRRRMHLRSNPEIIKLDPAVDTFKEAYLAWADASQASGEGFGTEVWREHIAEALSDPSEWAALQATFATLVPSSIPEEVFWVRYFFRVHQIEAEENRRKALLQATAENEDDFSWEDDEDESVDTKEASTFANPLESSQHTLAPPRTTSTSDVLSLPSSHTQSPRVSSEESYDVVSGNASSTGVTEAEEEEEEGEEEDNDWE